MEESEYNQRIEKMNRWSAELTNRLISTLGTCEKTLYHYTDSSGLLGIISSGQVWATHVSRLNDKTEYNLGLSLAESLALNCPTRLPNLVEKALEEVFSKDTYISCFSGSRDLLSQWRAYSGSNVGYCIGFESSEMATTDGRMPILEKVIYERETAKKVISRLIFEADEYLHTEGFGEVEVGYIIGTISGLLNVTACSTKHYTFSEENEYRFIYQPGSTDLELQVKYRDGQFGLTPYVEIDFLEKGKLPITSITIGPCEDIESEHRALDHLLFNNGYENVEILYSEIPLRV